MQFRTIGIFESETESVSALRRSTKKAWYTAQVLAPSQGVEEPANRARRAHINAG